eukprot:1356726-Rhodomonas_salina.1
MPAAFGITSSCTNHYLVDSGCTTMIVCNNQHLCNICTLEPRSVRGLIWSKTFTMCCNLHLPLVTTDSTNATIVLRDVIYDPTGDINLISTNDINKTDWDINLSCTSREGMYHYSHSSNSQT